MNAGRRKFRLSAQLFCDSQQLTFGRRNCQVAVVGTSTIGAHRNAERTGMTSATTQIRYHLHPQAAHRAVAGEVFVVTGDRAFHRLQAATAVALFAELGRTAAGSSEGELTDLLVRDFEVTQAQARADVTIFLATLVQRHLAVAATQDAVAAQNPPEKVTQ